MQELTFVVTIVATVSIGLLSLWDALSSKYAWKNNKTSEPPGPRLLPWIGRVHDLPLKYTWLKFKEWADMYGPLYRTKIMGANFIIISNEKVAQDLLVKRAKIYSDRPAFKSLFDSKSIMGTMDYLPLMGRNQYWSRQRKFVHSALTEAANAHYYGLLYHETKRLLMRLLQNPDDFCFYVEDIGSKLMCSLAWGDDTQSEYMMASARGLLFQMSPAGPITNLVTPLWDYLPESINPWKRAERKRHNEQQKWWMQRLQTVQTQMLRGRARPSWTRSYLEGQTGDLSGDWEASKAIGMMAIVGGFTIAGPLYYFLLSMVHYPEWQKKCQQEIDKACRGRMPELNDFPNLPILRACIKETMRWRPNIPTGVAHEVEADDDYQGYFIPKGARVLPLDYGFLRNPEKYPDPENFRPERWLEPEWPTYREPITQYPTIIGMSSFGWGQRTCLGQGVIRDATLVGCGGLIWAFNLAAKNGAYPPLDKSNSLLIIKPDPFEMAFHVRSESRKAEVVVNWNETNGKEKR